MRILVECADGSRALLEGEAAEKYLAKKREQKEDAVIDDFGRQGRAVKRAMYDGVKTEKDYNNRTDQIANNPVKEGLKAGIKAGKEAKDAVKNTGSETAENIRKSFNPVGKMKGDIEYFGKVKQDGAIGAAKPAMDRAASAYNAADAKARHDRRHGSKNEGCCNESADIFEGLDELFAD